MTDPKPSVEETPTGTTVETPTTPTVEIPEVKTYSQEEFDKAIQSASSKGKNEILKALGIDTVEGGKTKLARYDELIELEKQHNELKTAHAEVLSKQQEAEMNALLKELGIGEEGKELFLTLLETEKGEGTLLEKGQRVKDKLTTILSPDIKIGAGKTPAKDLTLQDEFKKLRKL